ncbi:type IIG restriction enzyme/methyltransferase, partial [Dolichospermum planctonicum]
MREYQEYLQPGENPDDHKLIALFKLLSPEHLLKLPFADSNTLDKGFYHELLHIIGLTEVKEGGKKLIQRKKSNERNVGSLMENAMIQLDSLDKISQVKEPEQFGETDQVQLFNIGLELAITWVNRILFLKLL